MKVDGGQAFPISQVTKSYDGQKDMLVINPGMSLRDWFAGMALQSYMAAYYQDHVRPVTESYQADEIAVGSYMLADSMLKARES